jgi:hypothetical protein
MKYTKTTITAETAEIAEKDLLCDLRVLCGECRAR